MSKSKNPYKKPDLYTKAAKKQGFPARSVFKLEEIDHRCRLLRPGQHVVDLGSAPGSWSLYVQRKIGFNGRLVSVDRQPLTVTLGPNASVYIVDLFDLPLDTFEKEAPFDVVLSDMAPNTSGMRDVDQWQSYELVMKAIEIAKLYGKKGSSFVAKIFMGPDYEKARGELRKEYADVRTLRPETVRTNSFEVFLVAAEKRHEPLLLPPYKSLEPVAEPAAEPEVEVAQTNAPQLAAPETVSESELIPESEIELLEFQPREPGRRQAAAVAAAPKAKQPAPKRKPAASERVLPSNAPAARQAVIGRRAASAKRAAAAKKLAAAKKAAAEKAGATKATTAKKAAPAQQRPSSKQVATKPAKKASSKPATRKPAPSKKAAPGKKPAPAKKAAPAKKRRG